MSEAMSATAQFSIYKIGFEAVNEVFNIAENDDKDKYAKSIVVALTNSILKILKDRPFAQSYQIQYKELYGVIFKTVHNPSWGGIAKEIINGNEYSGDQEAPDKCFLKNTNVSYVLFYPYQGNVYAVTGGYGSNYIGKFVERNFGLYLLPKVINRDNPVIKSIIQNNLLGNQTATQKTNKNSTSIFLEQDMSSIFRQLAIEANREIAEKLGIEFDKDESEKKKVNIVNKDSIVIHRSISISELKKLIRTVYSLEQSKDLFALNYLVLAKKKRLKNPELFDGLLEVLLSRDVDRFILTGDDYTSFYTCADKYVLKNEDGESILVQEAPIEFKDVLAQIPVEKRSKNALRTMLKKWTISTIDNAGSEVLYPLNIFDAIQGFIEYGSSKVPCYLFNGAWYVFDEKFGKKLTEEFEELYVKFAEGSTRIKEAFDLDQKADTEDTYNALLMSNNKIIVSHTVLLDYVEIADAIFWDTDNIYLMHNKTKFSGSGARDVTNQVLTSAEYLQQNLASRDRETFLNNYYDKIRMKYSSNGRVLPITREIFIETMISGRTIHYVIGYLEGYKKQSRTTYAKYLTIEVTKKLSAKGYRCTTIALS